MENLNIEKKKNESPHNSKGAENDNQNAGFFPSNEPLSEDEFMGQKELSALEEQKKGSDADQDAYYFEDEENDIDDQIKGSDSDYDQTSAEIQLDALVDDAGPEDHDEDFTFGHKDNSPEYRKRNRE